MGNGFPKLGKKTVFCAWLVGIDLASRRRGRAGGTPDASRAQICLEPECGFPLIACCGTFGEPMHGPISKTTPFRCVFVFALGIGTGCGGDAPTRPEAPLLSDARIVDLSHAYDETTVFWPTEEGFVLEKEFEGVTEKGYYYTSNRFRSPEHGGTHIDAPIHFAAGGDHVDEIPLERLIGVGVTVDVSEPCAKDRDHAISIRDLESWERAHGRIPERALVLLRTGFARYWPDRSRYLGTDERGSAAVAKLHFPGLSPEAARWLIDERRIKAVGIDTASIDRGQSDRFESHRALFERGVPAFENLAGLDSLPETGFQIVALPMKIRGGSGGPLRIIGVVPTP